MQFWCISSGGNTLFVVLTKCAICAAVLMFILWYFSSNAYQSMEAFGMWLGLRWIMWTGGIQKVQVGFSLRTAANWHHSTPFASSALLQPQSTGGFGGVESRWRLDAIVWECEICLCFVWLGCHCPEGAREAPLPLRSSVTCFHVWRLMHWAGCFWKQAQEQPDHDRSNPCMSLSSKGGGFVTWPTAKC